MLIIFGIFAISATAFAAINIVECVDAAMHHEYEDDE